MPAAGKCRARPCRPSRRCRTRSVTPLAASVSTRASEGVMRCGAGAVMGGSPARNGRADGARRAGVATRIDGQAAPAIRGCRNDRRNRLSPADAWPAAQRRAPALRDLRARFAWRGRWSWSCCAPLAFGLFHLAPARPRFAGGTSAAVVCVATLRASLAASFRITTARAMSSTMRCRRRLQHLGLHAREGPRTLSGVGHLLDLLRRSFSADETMSPCSSIRPCTARGTPR